MVVVDILLVCNLILLAVCAVRAPRRVKPGLDELLARARRPSPVPDGAGQPMGIVIPFPVRDQLARRRAMATHPSAGTAQPVVHPSGRIC